MKQNGVMIIGAGVVGRATGKGLIRKGNNVIFIDKEHDVVSRLSREGYSAYLSKDFDISNFEMNISMFCVNTPLVRARSKIPDASKIDGNDANTYQNNHGSTYLGDIISAVIDHSKWLKRRYNNNNRTPYHLFVIRSTVLPGTTEDILLPLVEKYSGLKVGKDFGLCMQPEFLRNVSAEHDFLHPRLIVIGQYDKRSGNLLAEIYRKFDCEIVRVDIKMAEFMKYVNNCFNATKISFSNEMWLFGKILNIDANQALTLAARSAEGLWNQYYGLIGGRPYDGRCLPKDAEGFAQFAKSKGFNMHVLSSSIFLNKMMAERGKPRKIPNEISLQTKTIGKV